MHQWECRGRKQLEEDGRIQRIHGIPGWARCRQGREPCRSKTAQVDVGSLLSWRRSSTEGCSKVTTGRVKSEIYWGPCHAQLGVERQPRGREISPVRSSDESEGREGKVQVFLNSSCNIQGSMYLLVSPVILVCISSNLSFTGEEDIFDSQPHLPFINSQPQQWVVFS